MEPRTALGVSIVTAALAIGIVGLDTVFGLHLTIEARDDGAWRELWADPTQDRRTYVERPYFDFCHGRDFRLVAENDKPLPDRVSVRVTYWDNATKDVVALVDERISLGPFETETVAWTVPPTAGVPESRYPQGEKPRPTVQIVIDEGYPEGYALDFCVREASA